MSNDYNNYLEKVYGDVKECVKSLDEEDFTDIARGKGILVQIYEDKRYYIGKYVSQDDDHMYYSVSLHGDEYDTHLCCVWVDETGEGGLVDKEEVAVALTVVVASLLEQDQKD